MLAKASFSEKEFRRGFDISFPLFHDKFLTATTDNGVVKIQEKEIQQKDKFLLTFKGKRYIMSINR